MEISDGPDTKDFGTYPSDDRPDLALKELSDSGTFAGYASVFGKKDLENEIVEAGAFKRTLDHNKGRFPLLWQHKKDEVIGEVEASEDLKGLHVKGRLSMGVTRAKDAYALMKDGVIRGMSIGFRTIQDSWEKSTGARHLKELRLHEVSLVTFAANPHATVTSIKAVSSYRNLPLAAETDRPWDSMEAASRVLAWAESASSEEERKSRMESAYLYRPRGQGPKLLIADVFGDELRVDPRAVDEVTAQVFTKSGAFAQKDLPAICQHLEKYHLRMEKPAPWQAPESLEALLAMAARLYPYADKESQKALLTALGTQENSRPERPFDWLFPESKPAAAVEEILDAMRIE